MSPLVYTLFRIGFLVLLWLFVAAVVWVLHKDVSGTQVRDRRASTQKRSDSHRRTTGSHRRNSGSLVETTPSAALGASAAPSPRRLSLVVTDGPLTGTSLPLGHAQLIVGRSPDSALVLGDSYSSSRHARFYQVNGQWWVEDLDSTNGTFIGGQRISQPTQVTPGTPIVIGRTTVEIR